MDKILVSACLMGDPVRYDGAAKPVANAHFSQWRAEGRLVSFCPEIAGGFTVPRLTAEIETGAGASDVLAGRARIVDSEGRDVTRGFLIGAQRTLDTAKKAGCLHAILMDGSPSCATSFIYTGLFDGTYKTGMGVTAAILARNGIRVWSHRQIGDLANTLSLKQ